MANYSAGTASVEINPDFRGFVTSLRAYLDGIDARLGVEIDPDTTGFANALQAKLNAIDAKLDVEINPDTTTFNTDLQTKLNAIVAKFGVEITPDTTGFSTDLQAKLSAIDAKLGVEINPDTTAFSADLQTKLNAIDPKLEVDIGVNDASLTLAEAKIRQKLGGITITVNVDTDTAVAAAELEALRAAHRAHTMNIDADTAVAAAELAALRAAHAHHTMNVDADTSAAAAQLAALRATLGGGGGRGGRGGFLGAGTILNLGALGLSLLPGAASAIASIGADVQALGANIALMPGLLAGAAAGVVTLGIGLDNMKNAFSDSPKKAAKAYAELSSEGRRVVDDLKTFGPQWDRIKDKIQDTTLDGLAQPLNGLLTSQLPALESGMDGLAGSFNGVFKTAFGELSNDKSVSAVSTVFGNSAEAAGVLNSAVTPVISSIRTLATTGSSFLPRLAAAFTQVATTFDNFLTKSQNSGDLWRWMDNGLDSARNLGSALGNLGSSLASIFRARRADGEGFLITLDKMTDRMATWLKSAEGQSEMKAFFREGSEQLDNWKPLLSSVGSLLKTVYEAAQAWSGILLPFLTAASSLLTSHDGILKTLIISYLAFRTVGPIFAAIQGAILLASGALGRFQAAMASSTATSAMSRGLVGLSAVLGPGGAFGLAVLATVGVLTVLASKHQDAAAAAAEQKRKLDELRDSMTAAGNVTKETVGQVGKDLGERGYLERAQSLGVDGQAYVNASLGLDPNAKTQINDRLTQVIVEEKQSAGGGWKDVKFNAGLSDEDIARALQGMPEAVEKYAKAVEDAQTRISEAGGETRLPDLAELKNKLNDVGESAATLGGEMNALDSNTAKAGEQMRQITAATEGTFAATEEGKRRIGEFGAAIVAVPDAKTVIVTAPKTDEERAKLAELATDVRELPGGLIQLVLKDEEAKAGIAQITAPAVKHVRVVVDEAQFNVGARQALNPGSGDNVTVTGGNVGGRALGGPITGGIAGQDSVPILAMPGEHMLTTRDVDKLGGQSGAYRFRAALQAGLVRPFANGGAVEWSQKDEIDLQQAQTAVTQAQEKADKTAASKTASDADKTQAQLKVQEAQLKAQELENKKNGTTSATTAAPQASLPGRATNKILERADAEDAVDQANARRNKVYADPASTDEDKTKADRAYQKAQNSLESSNSGDTSSDSGSLPTEYTAQGIGAKAGEAIATGILSFFGLENSILSSSNTYNKAFNSVIDYYDDSSSSTSSDSSGGGYSYTPKEVTVDDDTSSTTTGKTSTGENGDTSTGAEKTSYDPSAGVQQWSPTFTSVLGALAMPGSWLSLGLSQMQTESGGNPKAINKTDSNAAAGTPSKGLMQVIDPTFARYRSAKYPNDVWDPEANIAASLQYVVGRYGSPVGVWAQGHGYKDGGWVTGMGGPRSDSENVRVSPGEFIVNAASAAMNPGVLQAINSTPAALPAGFGTSSSSATTTNRDHSVHFNGPVQAMDPSELMRQTNRLMEQQTVGALAAF